MTHRDRLNKELYNVVSAVKDNVAQNLAKAQRDRLIQIEDSQLERALLLINQTIDAAYHASNKSFMRAVDEMLTAAKAGTNEKKDSTTIS